MTPTPQTLRTPLLRALATLSGFKPGVEVRARDVLRDALSTYPDADETRAKNNGYTCATQVLRPLGLLADGTQRGFWALTTEGVAAAQEPDKGSQTPVGAIKAPPPPLTPTPPFVPAVVAPVVVTPWADDTAGAVLYTTPVRDTYNDDVYIRALAIEHTLCFGEHDDTSPTCLSCPIANSCRSKQVMRLASAAAVLRKRDAEVAARGGVTPTTPVPPVVADETIDDVLADLEGTRTPPSRNPAPPPVPNGVEMEAQVDTVCFVCKKTIREKERGLFVPNVGMRHKTCP